MVLQLLTLTICMELNERGDLNSDSKRELSLINQLLDLLGTIAEGLTKYRIDWTKPQGTVVQTEHERILSEHIVSNLTRKWSNERPFWFEILQQSTQPLQVASSKSTFSEDEPYWLHDYTNVNDKAPLATADNTTSAATQFSSNPSNYWKLLDMIFAINQDIQEIVFEAQSIPDQFDTERLQGYLLDGCISLTWSLWDLLPESCHFKA